MSERNRIDRLTSHSKLIERLIPGLDNAAWGSHVYYSSVQAYDKIRAAENDEWYSRPMVSAPFGATPGLGAGLASAASSRTSISVAAARMARMSAAPHSRGLLRWRCVGAASHLSCNWSVACVCACVGLRPL